MEWYYVDAGKQAGPVSDAELDRLVKTGGIVPATLVWNADMTDWRPYREVRRQAIADMVPPLQTDAPTARCAECGNLFPEEEMVRYGEARICAGCKGVFFQRLKEGGGVLTVLNYAGFWIRCGAKILDTVLLWIVGFGIGLAVGLAIPGSGGGTQLVEQIVAGGLGIIVGVLYTVWFLGKYGATPGKMACGLKVVRPDGGPISYLRACGRHFAEMLSSMICLIGYIMVAFDEEKRSLHDRICDTRVIRK